MEAIKQYRWAVVCIPELDCAKENPAGILLSESLDWYGSYSECKKDAVKAIKDGDYDYPDRWPPQIVIQTRYKLRRQPYKTWCCPF